MKRSEFALEACLQNKTKQKKNSETKFNEFGECHFPPITKTVKYFEKQLFNSLRFGKNKS